MRAQYSRGYSPELAPAFSGYTVVLDDETYSSTVWPGIEEDGDATSAIQLELDRIRLENASRVVASLLFHQDHLGIVSETLRPTDNMNTSAHDYELNGDEPHITGTAIFDYAMAEVDKHAVPGVSIKKSLESQDLEIAA